MRRQEATRIPNLLVAPRGPVDGHNRDMREDGEDEHRGYYKDGTYFTSDLVSRSSDDVDEGEVGADSHLAYFDSILTRFETLHTQLAQIPPPEVIRRLGKDNPTHVGKLNTEFARWWRWKMRTVDPLPVQIACMEKSTVLRLLGLLTGGTLLKKGAEVEVGVSRWVWGLLARLPERGELTSEEIGIIRELGKKAVLVGMGLREDRQWDEGIKDVEAGYEDEDEDEEEQSYNNEEDVPLDLDEDLVDAGMDDTILKSTATSQQIGPQLPESAHRRSEHERAISFEAQQAEMPISKGKDDLGHQKLLTSNSATGDEGVLHDFAAVKARILAKLNEPGADEPDQVDTDLIQDIADSHPWLRSEVSKWNTRATVDMIITVAGEIFGQRDLLEFRSIWGEIL